MDRKAHYLNTAIFNVERVPGIFCILYFTCTTSWRCVWSRLCVVVLCVRCTFIFRWSRLCVVPPGAAPSAWVINAAAYLPSLGSGVPFLQLYPAAPAAGTERTRAGLFLLLPPTHPPHTPHRHHKPNHQTPPQLPINQTLPVPGYIYEQRGITITNDYDYNLIRQFRQSIQ